MATNKKADTKVTVNEDAIKDSDKKEFVEFGGRKFEKVENFKEVYGFEIPSQDKK